MAHSAKYCYKFMVIDYWRLRHIYIMFRLIRMKDLRLLSLLGNFDMLRNVAMLFDFLIYNITLCFSNCGDDSLA